MKKFFTCLFASFIWFAIGVALEHLGFKIWVAIPIIICLSLFLKFDLKI